MKFKHHDLENGSYPLFDWLTKTYTRVVMIVMFFTLIVIGIVQCTQMLPGVPLEDVAASKHYASDFLRIREKYYASYPLSLYTDADSEGTLHPMDWANKFEEWMEETQDMYSIAEHYRCNIFAELNGPQTPILYDLNVKSWISSDSMCKPSLLPCINHADTKEDHKAPELRTSCSPTICIANHTQRSQRSFNTISNDFMPFIVLNNTDNHAANSKMRIYCCEYVQYVTDPKVPTPDGLMTSPNANIYIANSIQVIQRSFSPILDYLVTNEMTLLLPLLSLFSKAPHTMCILAFMMSNNVNAAPTAIPTFSSTMPTPIPSSSPTQPPTLPTNAPSHSPSEITITPTRLPTAHPSGSPSLYPTITPTAITTAPTFTPSAPTMAPFETIRCPCSGGVIQCQSTDCLIECVVNSRVCEFKQIICGAGDCTVNAGSVSASYALIDGHIICGEGDCVVSCDSVNPGIHKTCMGLTIDGKGNLSVDRCYGYWACYGATFNCGTGSCIIKCGNAPAVCNGITINAANASDLTVHCNGCSSASITCPSGRPCYIVMEELSNPGITINGSASSYLNVYATVSAALQNAVIICPVSDNAKCELFAAGIYNDVLNGVHIYAIHSFNDLIFNAYCCTDANPIMYCTDDYNVSCVGELTTLYNGWSCVDTTSTCNHYSQSPTDLPTRPPTTAIPTFSPTMATSIPSPSPTQPSEPPTNAPSQHPSGMTTIPSMSPTTSPSESPSTSPSSTTMLPSFNPTTTPTANTTAPTSAPTMSPFETISCPCSSGAIQCQSADCLIECLTSDRICQQKQIICGAGDCTIMANAWESLSGGHIICGEGDCVVSCEPSYPTIQRTCTRLTVDGRGGNLSVRCWGHAGCKDATFNCGTGSCIIKCINAGSSPTVCNGITINAAIASDLTVYCTECVNAYIICPSGRPCYIETSESGNLGITIVGSASSYLHIYATANAALQNAVIITPTSKNSNCTITIGGIHHNALDGAHIYAVQTFNDFKLECFSCDEDSINPIIHCTEDYNISCEAELIAFPDVWSCINTTNTCNDYTRAPTLYPTVSPTTFAPTASTSAAPTSLTSAPTSAPSTAPTAGPTWSCIDYDSNEYNNPESYSYKFPVAAIWSTIQDLQFENVAINAAVFSNELELFQQTKQYENDEIQMIKCIGAVSCLTSNIIFVNNSLVNILCNASLSCSLFNLDITQSSTIDILCNGDKSCGDSLITVDTTAVLDATVRIQCGMHTSCNNMQVDIIGDAQTNITCYATGSCDGIHIKVEDFEQSRLQLHGHSENVKFDNGLGFQSIDGTIRYINCFDAFKSIKWDNTLSDTETDTLVRFEYVNDTFPCNNIQIGCRQNVDDTESTGSCLLSYGIREPDLPVINESCYWMPVSMITRVECNGNCFASPTVNPTSAPTVSPTSPTSNPSNAPSTPPSMAPTSPPSTAPSISPSKAPSFSPSLNPSNAPSISPTNDPTYSPSDAPTLSPTSSPTLAPLYFPTYSPTVAPSSVPTYPPSTAPSSAPSNAPSNAPSSAPSNNPSTAPSTAPSSAPSNTPSNAPSSPPSNNPSSVPSHAPSKAPTNAPTNAPSSAPSSAPSNTPSNAPSSPPSNNPSSVPSHAPSKAPTNAPTNAPSSAPSSAPSNAPSTAPTLVPSNSPLLAPTFSPTYSPSYSPTYSPTDAPTFSPTKNPTNFPTINADELYNSFIYITYLIKDLDDEYVDLLEDNSGAMMPYIIHIVESNYFIHDILEYKDFDIEIQSVNGFEDVSNINLKYNQDVRIGCIISCIEHAAGPLFTQSTDNADVFESAVSDDLNDFFDSYNESESDYKSNDNDRRRALSNERILFEIANKDTLEVLSEEKQETSYMVIVLCGIVVLIGLLLSLLLACLNSSRSSLIDNAKVIAPTIFALQVYDFISDINLCFEILSNPKALGGNNDGMSIILLCGICSVIFIVLPFSSNLWYGITIKSHPIIKHNRRADEYFADRITTLMGLIAISGGCHPSLLLLSSRFLNLDICTTGLTKYDLNRLAEIKLKSTICLENGPQLIIQIIYSIQIGDITAATYFAFIGSVLAIIMIVASFCANQRAAKDAHNLSYSIKFCSRCGPISNDYQLQIEKKKGRAAELQKLIAKQFNISHESIEIGYNTVISDGVEYNISHYISKHSLNSYNKLLNARSGRRNFVMNVDPEHFVRRMYEKYADRINSSFREHFEIMDNNMVVTFVMDEQDEDGETEMKMQNKVYFEEDDVYSDNGGENQVQLVSSTKGNISNTSNDLYDMYVRLQREQDKILKQLLVKHSLVPSDDVKDGENDIAKNECGANDWSDGNTIEMEKLNDGEEDERE
eukprot:116559_1